MDTSKYMIIDTSKRGSSEMFLTSRVSSIFNKNNKWFVTFASSPKTYHYRQERILFLDNPEEIDIEDKGFYLRNRSVNNVRRILKFSTIIDVYYHVVFDNGVEANYTDRELYVSRTTLDECGGDTFKYLNKLADETGLMSENGINILKTQYDWIDNHRLNVPLAQYIGYEENLSESPLPNTVIYPFSCNASQKLGVENALTHQLSIIQGPPGTGKTQTILNIISNILLQGKTVLVVSNNNSAVQNVAEKLSSEKIGLGFLIAQLGKKANKELFIDNQPSLPDMSAWKQNDIYSIERDVNQLLETVSDGFKIQKKYAALKTELQSIKTESRYNDIELSEYVNSFKDLFKHTSSDRIISLKFEIERLSENNKKIGLLFTLKCMFKYGFKVRRLLKQPIDNIIKILECFFYTLRLDEINNEIAQCEEKLKDFDLKNNLDKLSAESLKLLKDYIAASRQGSERKVFVYDDIKHKSEEFLKEYPIVLSTTYACKNCISKKMVFDYIIMDEASQVDITTGALALSCANNAVIVGDDKQLPNVVDSKTMTALNVIEKTYRVEDKYCSSTHSFLQSCCEVFSNAPQTLLREHYRCHPKIIEFCNQMFYDGELITMTTDNDEKDVISIIRTAVGQHAREHYNQRKIDVIKKEILPEFDASESVGIISPYHNQAEYINSEISIDIASTVHKYQGRECDSIIMSLVDNSITSFSDDANLLNVAVSRAKSKLYIVVTGNDIPVDTNVGHLIAYANYNNFEIRESSIHSVFDILYKQYTEQRLAFDKLKNKDLGELSENLIYDLLQRCIASEGYKNIGILCHYPLYRLVGVGNILNDEERDFARSTLSHVDFLLYNTITKQPQLCIEVDGWKYHSTEVQKKRDAIKDRIFDKYSLSHVRLSTVDTVNEESVISLLRNNYIHTVI